LIPEDESERMVGDWRGRLGSDRVGAIGISSATGAGLDDLVKAIFEALPEEDEEEVSSRGGEFEAEHRVYRPGAAEGVVGGREGGRWFRVTGRGLELLTARHHPETPEALDSLESRLGEIGVTAALERGGFERGDEVIVGELEFVLEPG